jgi:pyridoxine 5-phosphate synthase
MALLGVNVDHVATVRNARGTWYPDPIQAALIAEEFGADGITAHLREDRRHIRDDDMFRLKEVIKTRLNMEMANTPEMIEFAQRLKPYMVTIVPERREELTTEGGLDVIRFQHSVTDTVRRLQDAGILVSLFIDGDESQVSASQQTGATIIELHTGRYCEAPNKLKAESELGMLISAAQRAVDMGLEVNAGHGLNYTNVTSVLSLPGLNELNIGHAIVAESLFMGFGPAVRRMKDLIS